MNLAAAALVGAGVAAASAAAGAALVVWAGPLDRPRARGSHSSPTVTSGGVAVMVGSALGLVAFALLAPPEARTDLGRVALALAAAGALGLLGLLDDLFDVGARTKLVLQVLAGIGFAALVARPDLLPVAPGLSVPLSPVLSIAGTALWLVLVTNAVNFVDGSNGMAAGCTAIALAVLSASAFGHGEQAVGAAAVISAVALIGFLPWNLPMGRLFQGDVGALFAGFLVGALAVVAATAEPGRSASLYIVPFALTPMLTDVLLTLVLRARRGASLLQAHRDHLYQVWLARTGQSHGAVALRAWGLTAAYGAAGLAAEAAPRGVQPLLFSGGVLACAAGWVLVRRRLED